MKKMLSFLFILMFLTVTNGYALPLWDDTQPISLGGIDYTIVDREGGWNDSTPNPDFNSAYSGYIGTNWTGFYIGTVTDPGNDSNGGINYIPALINYYLSSTLAYTSIEKVDEPATTSGALTVTYATDLDSGTWVVSGSNDVSVYSVKGSTEWALYYVDPSQLSGIWTTEHLLNGGGNIPEISHLSAVLTESVPTVTPVPEPATMFLLGAGLVGLAGVGRKRFKK